MSAAQKTAILAQVGHFYFGAVGQSYLGANTEVIGGLVTNSLALLSDAAHMATDTAGLVIALVAVRLARRPPDARRTFGYARLEALGVLANGTLLLGVAAYILWEAVGRFRAPPPVAATGMLLVAVAGLI
nr:cation transporter [Steroidobacteraceae bacterium]